MDTPPNMFLRPRIRTTRAGQTSRMFAQTMMGVSTGKTLLFLLSLRFEVQLPELESGKRQCQVSHPLSSEIVRLKDDQCRKE